MTLSAVDSAGGTFPAGFDVYMGYVDRTVGGHTATYAAAQAAAKANGAKALSVTTDADWTADVFDMETGAEHYGTAAAFCAKKTTPRPILYCGVRFVDQVTSMLAAAGIARSDVRFLSAHYGDGEHICGPDTCGYCATPCDGTQWAGTAGGTDTYDVSVLVTSFFATPIPEAPEMIYGIVEYANALWSVFPTAGQVCKRHLSAAQVAALVAAGTARLHDGKAPWTTAVIASLPVVA